LEYLGGEGIKIFRPESKFEKEKWNYGEIFAFCRNEKEEKNRGKEDDMSLKSLFFLFLGITNFIGGLNPKFLECRRVRFNEPVTVEIKIPRTGFNPLLITDLNELYRELLEDDNSIAYLLKSKIGKIYIISRRDWRTFSSGVIDATNLRNYRRVVPEIREGDGIIIVPEFTEFNLLDEETTKALFLTQLWTLYFHALNPESNTTYHRRISELYSSPPLSPDDIQMRNLTLFFLQHLDMVNTYRFMIQNGKADLVEKLIDSLLGGNYWQVQMKYYMEIGKTIWFWPLSALGYTMFILPFELEAGQRKGEEQQRFIQIARRFENRLKDIYFQYGLFANTRSDVDNLFSTIRERVINDLKSALGQELYPSTKSIISLLNRMLPPTPYRY